MELASAQDQLDSAVSNTRVALATGDYGPLIIDRPLTLDCNGASVWAHSAAPSICVRSVDVVVENAILCSWDKPTDGSWPLVLEIEANAGAHFRNVKLAGTVRGDGAESGPWIIPSQIELGVMDTSEAYFTMDLAVPVPCRLVSRVQGIDFDPAVLVIGINKVRLKVADIPRDTILWGTVELRSDQFARLLPLHGRVSIKQAGTAGATVHLHPLTSEQETVFYQALNLDTSPLSPGVENRCDVSAGKARSERPDTALATSDGAPESHAAIPPSSIRKPAIWEDKPATPPWCPEAIQPHLGFGCTYKDNYTTEEAASPGWCIVAATHRGRMHAHHGTHREDAFLCQSDEDFTIACVCGGVGSSDYSRIGSESTCRKVVGALAAALKSRRDELHKLPLGQFNLEMQMAIGEAVSGACTSLHELAAVTSTNPNDFRCTLVLGVLWVAGESPLLVFSQVGDGFMAWQGKGGRVQRYGESNSGAFSGENDYFIPGADAVWSAQHVVAIGAANVDAFIFCSDGIEDPFHPTETKSRLIFQQLREGVCEPLPGFEMQKPHGPVIGAPEARERLAAWLEFEKKAENDDRTILILHRTPSQMAGMAENIKFASEPKQAGSSMSAVSEKAERLTSQSSTNEEIK